MALNGLLDWKRLHFDVLDEDRWLLLGKDLWKEIFLLVVTDSQTEKQLRCGMGKINFLALWKLRVVCRLFSRLIDPKFCLKVIYLNPYVNVCKWKCVECSLNFEKSKCYGRSYYCRQPYNINAYYDGESTYRSKTFRWSHNPKNGVLRKKRIGFIKTIEQSESKTQTLQRYPVQVTEPTLLNRIGGKLFEKNVDRQYWNKRNAERIKCKEWNPRWKVDQKKSKWWKKNGNRKIMETMECDSNGCYCDDCRPGIDYWDDSGVEISSEVLDNDNKDNFNYVFSNRMAKMWRNEDSASDDSDWSENYDRYE